MADTILHCFDPGSAEAEGKIIGSLLAGYGELELEMALCLIAATGNYDASLKALYSVRGEEKRIKKADRMMKVQYVNAKLAIDYKQTISDMQWCRKIRNQYAHSQWYYTPVDGLCFVDLEASLCCQFRLRISKTIRCGLTSSYYNTKWTFLYTSESGFGIWPRLASVISRRRSRSSTIQLNTRNSSNSGPTTTA
jgi:hypothetical protein